MARIVTSISVLKELKEEALNEARAGKYPGISDFSSMVEYALDRLLHPDKYLSEILDNQSKEMEVPV